MKRPLLFIFLFLICGICIAIFTKSKFLIFLLFIILFVLAIYFKKKFELSSFNILLLFSIIGFMLTTVQFNREFSPFLDSIENKKEVYIEGNIKSIYKISDSKLKVLINSKYVSTLTEDFKKKLNFIVYLKEDKGLQEGVRIKVKGILEKPKLPTNPNAYNEYLNYKINKTDYKLFANSYSIEGIGNKLLYYLTNLNKSLGKIFDKILPKEESSILKAMILGDKVDLDPELKELYRNTGIYHILAISGLHIGILAMFLTKIFDNISKKYGKIIVILILIFYCILTGGNLATVRATLMATIMLIGLIINREPDFISSICFSAIIILLINPLELLNIGFLYSYTSVFAIAFLAQRCTQIFNIQGIFKALTVSFFVSIAIKPITAFYFYNFNTLDIFLNIIILPFMSIIVCIGFLCMIIGLISIPLAEFLIGTVYYILRFFTFTCKIVDNMQFSNILVGKPSIFILICFYFMLILIGYAIYDKDLMRKRKKYLIIGFSVFIAGTFFEITMPKYSTVTMLDIGQGDSIIGETKEGTFIIDGGGSPNFSTGDTIILPYLKSKGISQVDFAFITHMDSDHSKGIIEIIDKIKIKNIFIPNVFYNTENYFKLVEKAQNQNTDVFLLERGDKLTLGENTKFNIFHPPNWYNNKKENNNSLVFNFEHMGSKILFTGDIEEDGEIDIMESNIDIDADILKVAHHGSKSSTTDVFLAKVSPKTALISCKLGNSYNHPNEEVLNRLKEQKVYRTDKDGAIIIKFYKDNFKIKTILGR